MYVAPLYVMMYVVPAAPVLVFVPVLVCAVAGVVLSPHLVLFLSCCGCRCPPISASSSPLGDDSLRSASTAHISHNKAVSLYTLALSRLSHAIRMSSAWTLRFG